MTFQKLTGNTSHQLLNRTWLISLISRRGRDCLIVISNPSKTIQKAQMYKKNGGNNSRKHQLRFQKNRSPLRLTSYLMSSFTTSTMISCLIRQNIQRLFLSLIYLFKCLSGSSRRSKRYLKRKKLSCSLKLLSKFLETFTDNTRTCSTCSKRWQTKTIRVESLLSYRKT